MIITIGIAVALTAALALKMRTLSPLASGSLGYLNGRWKTGLGASRSTASTF
jgi:hypothetical protein